MLLFLLVYISRITNNDDSKAAFWGDMYKRRDSVNDRI